MIEHIKSIRHQINTLQAEAISVLENAKSEVEQMILE